MSDPDNLRRFVEAQDEVYEAVCDQLRRGRKTTHWMWFVFPQLTELGRSERACCFGIGSRSAHSGPAQIGLRISQPCPGTSTCSTTSGPGAAEPATTSPGDPVKAATGTAMGASATFNATISASSARRLW